MSIKVFDIILAIILLLAGYKGFRRGIVLELFSTLSFILGFVISVKLLKTIIEILGKSGYSVTKSIHYITFVFLFITTVLSLIFISKMFKYIIRFTLIGSLDNLLGTIVGILKWSFFISTFIWLGNLIGIKLPHSYTEGSCLFPYIQSILPYTIKLLYKFMPSIQELISKIDYVKA